MTMARPRTIRALTTLTAIISLVTLAGCASNEPGPSSTTGGGGGEVVFWTPFNTPPRMAKQQQVATAFTAKTGIKVKVVGISAADQNQALVTGAASGKVPDVILHAPDQTAAWTGQGLLDTDASQKIVDKLGRQTFSEQALNLVTGDGKLGAVPSDGWAHLLVYRKDLLAKAGVATPKTIDDVAAAAGKLKSGKVSGIALGTQPGTPSATEALESVLQPTGCQLVESGKVTIDSPACTHGLELFKKMADSSAAGQFDVTSARGAYLAGNAAMLLFSSHIIDELDGLDPANPPSCPECAADKQFLAKNSGFVTVLQSADGKGAQYGSTLNYGVPKGAKTAAASQFIEYVLSDGYTENLSSATEGRVPLRTGTASEPTKYVDAWSKLPFGADPANKKSVADVYGADVAASVAKGATSVSRWAFGTKDAPLEGRVFSQNLLSKNLDALLGGAPANQVSKQMAQGVMTAQKELG